MKRFWATSICIALVLSMAGISLAKPVNLKFAHIANTDNTWHLAALKFAELVEEKTNGQVTVTVFPNSVLGSERETIEGIPLGLADLTITADSLANWVPIIALQSHMYTFRDSEHIERFMNSKIADKIRQDILNQAGLRVIAWFERGPRYLTSNRPISHPRDLRGFKIRVPDVPMFIRDWEAAGANPTPMAFAEVFTGLQQGVIDGQENPLALIESAKLYEVQKYVNRTAHVRQGIFVVIGEAKFKTLSPENQTAILEAAEEMQRYERELFLAKEQELEDFLKSKGMIFNDDVDIEAFQQAVADVVAKHFPQLVEDFLAIQEL